MKILISLLYDKGSIEHCLMDLFKISKQQLKKFKLNKKFLKSEVKSKQCVELPIDLVNHLLINPSYDGKNVEVLLDDENFLVLSKPFKVHMHPLSYGESDNLLSFIRNYNASLLEVNSKKYDRGLIYRLDYETSGIVYYAKSHKLYDNLRSNFHKVMIEKSYFAIVAGEFIQAGEHTHFLKPLGPNGHKMQAFNDEQVNSQRACLKVDLLEYNKAKDISLVKVFLKTGLRHQIRCQLSFLGHPIVGDELYGTHSNERLFLHAYQYKFKVDKNFYDLTCDVDKLFKNFFNFDSRT